MSRKSRTEELDSAGTKLLELACKLEREDNIKSPGAPVPGTTMLAITYVSTCLLAGESLMEIVGRIHFVARRAGAQMSAPNGETLH